MLNIVRFSEKLDMPGDNPYAKKRPTFQEYLKTLTSDTKEYDLDGYGIKLLQHIPFSPDTEMISLFDNQIENPGEISSLITELPKLKALWVNGNPVVENCVNFNQIGEHMPELEIINSKFTSRAGEWALLFYARDQKVERIEDIRKLELTAKGLLHMKDISIFSRCTSMKTLDITGHPEFFHTDE
jgi:hypothetical protein